MHLSSDWSHSHCLLTSLQLHHLSNVSNHLRLKLEELEEKLNLEENWPKDIMKLKGQDKVTFYSITENDLGQPIVKYSLVITENLKFTMWCNEVKLPLIKVIQIKAYLLTNN